MTKENTLTFGDYVEFFFVCLICFGIPIFVSLISWRNGSAFSIVEFNDERLVQTLLYELIIVIICIVFLWLRRFNIWEKIYLRPTTNQTLLAFGLCVLSYLAYFIFYNIAVIGFGSENLQIARYKISVSFIWVVAISTVNPMFEELFVLGYIFEKLKTRSVWIAIALSVVIRTSYHLYQGWIAILSILPVAIIFALFYAKKRNLWAFYLAHLILDLVGMTAQNH